ncbi:MAG: ATP-binding protein [Rikenellaceae bacterium]
MDNKFEILNKYNFWNTEKPELGFKRKIYAEKIKAYCHINRLIKVLTGQRRVGKSYILRQITWDFIEGGIDPKNILYISCELIAFNFIKSYTDLQEAIEIYKDKIKPQGKVYLFLDEVQNIEGWEKAVNSFSQDYVDSYEVFISGSNSKMLSSELSTLLSGRYVRFEIFPFSFEEYCEAHDKELSKANYIEYSQTSGLPELFTLEHQETKRNYISSIKDTVLLRDIIQRHNIKDTKLLEDIFIYIVNNASSLLSIRNIANYFTSNGRKTSYDTVAAYIGYIEDTYLIHKCERYNIKGKETISGVCKYYINDLGFHNYLYQGFGYGIGYQLENLVYLELARNGYDIYVGSIKGKEVDFVATKGDRTIYLQVAYILTDNETLEREYSSLQAIGDNHEKYVVSLDDYKYPSLDGIKHIQGWQLHEIL